MSVQRHLLNEIWDIEIIMPLSEDKLAIKIYLSEKKLEDL
jgi:hypothetical protein